MIFIVNFLFFILFFLLNLGLILKMIQNWSKCVRTGIFYLLHSLLCLINRVLFDKELDYVNLIGDPGADSWVGRKSKRVTLQERTSKVTSFDFLLPLVRSPM